MYLALSKMKLLTLIGMTDHLDEAIAVLGESGVFHPDDAAEFFSEIDRFIPVASKNETASTLSKLKNIMAMAKIEPEIINTSNCNYNADEIEKVVNEIEKELGESLREKEDINLIIKDSMRKIEDSTHFVGLDLSMDEIEACEFIASDFGRLPKESFEKLKQFDDNEFVQFFPVSSDDKYYWGVYTAPIDQADEIDSIFSALYFL